MKLRIQGSSIRLRLKQPEVTTLAETGRVEDRIEIGPGAALTYALETSDVSALSVRLDGSDITVLLPRDQAAEWTDTDNVGLEAELATDSGTLQVLVEKDFQCLHRRPKEDESDNFPHPEA